MSQWNPTVYLAGPVQHMDDGGSSWRDRVKEEYGEQFEFLDPLSKYDTPAEDVAWLQPDETRDDYPDDVEVLEPDSILRADKEMIDESDYVLIGLREMVPMYGTPREHEYAHNTDTPVVLWHRDDMELSPWAISDTFHISSDLRDCLETIYVTNTRDALEQTVVNTMTEKLQ